MRGLDATMKERDDESGWEELERLIGVVHDAQQRALCVAGSNLDAAEPAWAGVFPLSDPGSFASDQVAAHLVVTTERNAMLNALPMRTALLDATGTIQVVNKVWEEYVPKLGDCVGCKVGEIYLDYWKSERVRGRLNADEAIKGIHAILQEEATIFSWEYELATYKGSRWFRLIVSPLAGGIRKGAMVVHSDITDRKRMEDAQRLADEKIQQMQRLDAIGQLTGGIAHDFNNLLTVVMGKAEQLQESFGQEDVRRQWADELLGVAERGALLTQRLLAFARRQALQPRALEVTALLKSTAALLHRSLGEHVTLVFAGDPSPRFVLADAVQLENAVINLCINARDAMPGGGTITIQVSEIDVAEDCASPNPDLDPGPYVTIAIADTGDGMDEATLGRCFEPFFTTKATGKGTGLGLSMVYGFIKQSMGAVTIFSAPGEGTRVVLVLPRLDHVLPHQEVDAEDDVPGGSGRHVLIVEDNDMVGRHVVEQVQSLGYHVRAVSNAVEALAVLSSCDRIDLLFSDIVMPGGMNGLELAGAARERRPGLPVLLTSGYAEAVRFAAKTPFTEDLLVKPYRKVALARKLHAAVSK